MPLLVFRVHLLLSEGNAAEQIPIAVCLDGT